MSNKPELIELLLTNLKEFEKKFQELLNRVPNIHSPNKMEFFTHFFLGSILTLSYSELIKKCSIENILFKLVKNKQGLVKVIKLFFKAQKKLMFVTITTVQDVEHYNVDELKEIANKLEIRFIGEYDIQGKVFHIRAERLTEQESKPFKLNMQDLKVGQEKKLCETFRNVLGQQHTNVGDEFYIVNLNPKENFESYVLTLSNVNINEVKVAIEKILKKLVDICKEYEKLLDKTESAYHGFVYGFLAMNYKYRYDLDCYVERIEGKGYTDLTLISRKDNKKNKNWNAVPAIVEFKAGTESADKAIKQIKDRGYLYTPLSMRTFAKRGVIAGVNFALSPGVVVETVEIYQSQSFMDELLSGINNLLKTADNAQRDNIKNNLKEKIEKEIKYLYFSASGVKTENYLSRLILGQMLAAEVPNGSKHIFVHDDKYLSFYDGENEVIVKSRQISTFLIKKQSESLVFNIIEYKGTGIPVTRQKKPVRFEGRYFFTSQDNKYTEFNIKVNLESVETKSLEIDVNCVNDFSEKEYQGKLSEIKNITLDSFFDIKEGDSKDVTKEDQESQNEAISMLEKKLLPHKGLIESESHFQAVMQGLLMNYKKEDKKTLVFTEANPSGQGRIDLVISLFGKNNSEHKITVIELKYAKGKINSQNKFNEAKEQVEKYKTNLKTFSDEKNFTELYMVFNAAAQNDKQLIYYGTMFGNIEHTSQSETERGICSIDISESKSEEVEKKRLRTEPDISENERPKKQLKLNEIDKLAEDLNLKVSLVKKGVVRLGDMCNVHGDYPQIRCIEGSENVFINDRPVHCQGDKWSTHASADPYKPPHISQFLLKGSNSVFVNGKAIARTGDLISCGAVAEQGSNNVFAG